MTKLKLAYFGTPDFSADLLERLITDPSIKHLIEIVFVVTQPDRPVGRKQILTPTPVKLIAKKYGLKCLEIKNWDLIKNLKLEIRNLDFCLLYAFGKKIPSELLNLPRSGFINIHPSLLPKYRGPSPIAYPLINGDTKTGVTLMKMDDQIDHGPIIAQEELEILPTDKRPDLEKKLTNLGFKLIVQSINQLDNIKFQEQNHSAATYTKLLKKEDGFIEFKNLELKIKNSPKQLFDLFRGLYPWPCLWTILPNGKRLKIIDMELSDFKDFKTLRLIKVQLEGKKEVDFVTFQKAYGILNKLPTK